MKYINNQTNIMNNHEEPKFLCLGTMSKFRNYVEQGIMKVFLGYADYMKCFEVWEATRR